MADFVFADEYQLGQNQTRRFYESFLKGYIHKHNNLMGVIQGFSSLILYEDSINAEVRESAEQMQTSSRIATELNREVMGASGCSRCDSGIVRIADALPYWKGKSEEICAESSVGFTLNASASLPPVTADSTRLGEVIFHLIRNAVDSAADFPQGSVAVDIFPPGEASPGGTVDLFIRNQSADLSESQIRNCFVPFESSKGAGHFGIGLTSAAILAGDMGCRLGLRCAEGTMTAWLSIATA
jgi:two-component system, NtrC family, nitrogen regulation sensor histidine kinase GlnL